MRTDATFEVEHQFFANGHTIVAGVDEVGRGCIAGPLVVGAVAVCVDTPLLPGLRDSKVLSAKRRAALDVALVDWSQARGVGVVSAAEIDEVGMSRALRLGVARALERLSVTPTAVIVDGPVNLAPHWAGDVVALPKADGLCASVAAASIVAKQWRDAYMLTADSLAGAYGFCRHKGYGTPEHYRALAQHGPGEEHRRSFRLA